MRIELQFLGPSRELAGCPVASLDIAPELTITGLRAHLAIAYPNLAPALPTIRFAIRDTFANDEMVLSEGDEVALIPPVSGGSGAGNILIDLVKQPIHAQQVRDFIMGDPTLGGIATFEGMTRREEDPDQGQLLHLDYEAHESMAVKQMERLAGDAMAKWKAGRIAIVHRIGIVAPADASVMIAVACGHRAEAFEACRWLIDTLKKDVPIWKKDVFENGHIRWVDPKENGSSS